MARSQCTLALTHDSTILKDILSLFFFVKSTAIIIKIQAIACAADPALLTGRVAIHQCMTRDVCGDDSPRANQKNIHLFIVGRVGLLDTPPTAVETSAAS